MRARSWRVCLRGYEHARSLRRDELADVQEKVSTGLSRSVKFLASQALNIGSVTLEFVVSFMMMLYLLFFLLRDGGAG